MNTKKYGKAALAAGVAVTGSVAAAAYMTRTKHPKNKDNDLFIRFDDDVTGFSAAVNSILESQLIDETDEYKEIKTYVYMYLLNASDAKVDYLFLNKQVIVENPSIQLPKNRYVVPLSVKFQNKIRGLRRESPVPKCMSDLPEHIRSELMAYPDHLKTLFRRFKSRLIIQGELVHLKDIFAN